MLQAELKDNTLYDVIIIGGGIQGATLAWEAARHQLDVLLLEERDFGSQTSANNLKVIHGGIRYIQNLDLRRTIASIKERDFLLQIAPHLVTPLSCLTPITGNLIHNKLTYGLASGFYNYLSANFGSCFGHGIDATRVVNTDAIAADVNPGTGEGNYLQWQDAQVRNSERLVYSFIRSARLMGAVALNYTRVIAVDHQLRRVRVSQPGNHKQTEVSARFIVDASGPWQNRITDNNGFKTRAYVQGINLVCDKKILDQAMGVSLRYQGESRLIYGSPWNEATLFGTWYFPSESSATGIVTKKKIQNCLSDINRVFPHLQLQIRDISMVHSGCLPQHRDTGPGNSYSSISSRDVIQTSHYRRSKYGCISVSGVKLTTARQLAAKVLKKYILDQPYDNPYQCPERWKLFGAEKQQSTATVKARFAFLNLDTGIIEQLVSRYGDQAEDILSLAASRPDPQTMVPDSNKLLSAEVDYLIENEDVMTLSDLLVRRSGIAAVAIPDPGCIDYCAKTMRHTFGWTQDDMKHNIEGLKSRFLTRQ